MFQETKKLFLEVKEFRLQLQGLQVSIVESYLKEPQRGELLSRNKKEAVSKVVNRHCEGGTTDAICFIIN